MKFKKILATVGSVLMLSSVIGGAFAAGLPTTLKADNTVIVQGTGSNDANAISTLQTELAKSATQGAVSVSGDSEQIKANGVDLWYNQKLNDVRDVLTASNSKLKNVLASGKIRYGSTTRDYEQKLTIGENKIAYGKLASEDDYIINANSAEDQLPVLYLNQPKGEPAWTLAVEFKGGTFNATDVRAGEVLKIAGREYTVAKDLTADDELILYASSQTEIVNVGEQKTITIDGESYLIEVEGADTDANPAEASIKINGEKFQVKNGDDEYVGDQKFYINRVFTQTIPTPTAAVEIFVGADELNLGEADGVTREVVLNDETVEGMKVNLTGGNLTKIKKIEFQFTPFGLDDYDGAAYLEVGESVADPVFGTINMVFNGASMDFRDSEKEVIKLSRSGEDLVLNFKNRDGTEYTLKPAKDSRAGNDTAKMNWNDKFFYNVSENLTSGQVVILEEGRNLNLITRLAKVTKLDKDKITFTDEATKETTTVGYNEQIWTTGTFVCNAGEDKMFNLSSKSDCSNAYVLPNIYTSNNMELILVPKDDGDLEKGLGNLTVIEQLDQSKSNANWTILVNADTKSTKGEFTIVTTDEDSEGIKVLFGGKDNDNEKGYYLSEFGTYVETEKDDNKLTMYVPSEKVTYDVTIASEVSSIGEAGKLIVADTDAAKMSGKNLIVVGGSAINSVAAQYLGFDGPAYGEDFTEKTGVSAGEYLIQSFDKDDGKVAIVVAGYNAADTENGAKYLALKDYQVGKKYKGTTADVAQEVTA